MQTNLTGLKAYESSGLKNLKINLYFCLIITGVPG